MIASKFTKWFGMGIDDKQKLNSIKHRLDDIDINIIEKYILNRKNNSITDDKQK